jgi:hypothetical protein
MKNFALVAGLLAVIAAGAWAADMAVEKAPPATSIETSPGYDATVELKWDNGATAWLIAWYTGAGTWVANDYDISTIKTYPYVKTIRFMSGPAWPNGTWDGFRLGVYARVGGVPGSLIWGPKFAIGTSSNYAWHDFAVDWSLPSGLKTFLPAIEQYYNYPNCDPHVCDNNSTFLQHSWVYYGGSWSPNTNGTGYFNIMLRVVMDNEHNPGVLPTSVGRVKALYY